LIAFLLYFFILLAIGLFAHKKQTTSAEFLMGNRSMSYWLVALSAHASDMSSWLFMGLPMSVFLLGFPQAWIAVGLLLGMFLNWQFIAPKLRSETEKYNSLTLSGYFEQRFADRSGSIRVISAIMLIVFLTHYLSAGMIGIGLLFESLFSLNYYFGLILAMCVVVIYTFVGGFVAVAWTDLFQGLFLLLVIVAVPWLAYSKIDGFSDIVLVASSQSIPLSIFPGTDIISIFTVLMLSLSWGLGYFGMPHVITKFMSINSVKELNKSKWLGMTWQLIVLSAAVAIGLIAIAMYPQGMENPQMVFVEMVKDLFHPFIAGFVLCAVIAASMSTMDSQILVSASVLSEDLFGKLFPRHSNMESKLLVSRLGVVLVSVVALALSLNKNTTIMDSVSYSWAGLGSAFGPLVLTALYSKTANRFGAIAGVITGGLVVMVWPQINPLILNYAIPSMIPGFLCSLAAIYLVSFVTMDEELIPVRIRVRD